MKTSRPQQCMDCGAWGICHVSAGPYWRRCDPCQQDWTDFMDAKP